MRAMYILLVAIVFLGGCSSGKRNSMKEFGLVNTDEVSKDVSDMKVLGNEPVLIENFNMNTDKGLFLSDVVDSVWGVKLETSDESIIGVIDRIQLFNGNIYVLDRYKTKSLKCFEMNGTYIRTIGRIGNGPGEYVEITDFLFDENGITIYDQFQHKFIFFNDKGDFVDERKLPFYFLRFYRFDQNNYLFSAVNADNEHLDKIVGYSVWSCDSTSAISKRGRYKKKDKYTSYLVENNFQKVGNNVYYKEAKSDTIFRISDEGNIHAELVVGFGKMTPPDKLFLSENQKEFHRERKLGNYAFGFEYLLSPDYLYYSYSVAGTLFHLIYSRENRSMVSATFFMDDISRIFYFSRIYGIQDNILIGYVDSMNLYTCYTTQNKNEWLNLKGFKGEDLSLQGKSVVEFCENIDMNDNPIVLFYKLKEKFDKPEYVSPYKK